MLPKKSIIYILIITLMFTITSVSFAEELTCSLNDINRALVHSLSLLEIKDGVPSEPIPFYDLDEKIIAYGYTIKGENKVGYTIIGATKDVAPVLEFGEGELPVQGINKGKKLYYLGAFNYVPASNANEVFELFEKHKQEMINSYLEKNIIVPEEIENLELKSINRGVKSFEKQWENLLNNSDVGLKYTWISNKLYVDHLYQYTSGVYNGGSSACGPTTGAMIAEWWRTERGYRNIAGTNIFSDADFINNLYDHMGTTGLGTSYGNFANGLEEHCNEHYSVFDTTIVDGDDTFAYYDYMDEIVAERPVGVLFHNLIGGDENWHWVCGDGYRYSSDDVYHYIQYVDPGVSSSYNKSASFDANKSNIMFVFLDN